MQEKSSGFFKLPAEISCRPTSADGITAEWIAAPDARSGMMLYLHGGGYALGSISTHREIVSRLSRATSMRALLIAYRLAPEHPFPAALEDTLTAYRRLLKQGHDPSRIIIAGDSAGGGLTLAALVALRDASEPLPAGAIIMSPWTDLAHTGASIESKKDADPVLTLESSRMHAQYYAGENALDNPLISPLYADFSGLPPLLIQVGSDEILLDDAVRCAEKAKAAGVDVTLEVWEGMFHVFQLVPNLPESKTAVANIARFTTRVLKSNDEIVANE